MSPQLAAPKRSRSTGPRTKSGKAISSKNALLHGLASSTIIMPGEDPAALQDLEVSLRNQFRPKTAVETILVLSMVKHHWLSQRAMRLQAEVLNPANRKKGEIPNSLAVLHRYQVSNDRAFYKCLETLNTLQKQELNKPKQFVSQNRFHGAANADPIALQLSKSESNQPLSTPTNSPVAAIHTPPTQHTSSESL